MIFAKQRDTLGKVDSVPVKINMQIKQYFLFCYTFDHVIPILK